MAKKSARTSKKKAGTPAEPAKREYPLRNKRRLETRAALIKAAQELMSTHGFNSVTMQQVADHAGSHAQTLYAHFSNKHALGAAAGVETLRAAMTTRKTDTMTFWRRWVERLSQESLADDSGDAFMRYVIDQQNDPQLSQLSQAIAFEHLDILTDNLAADFSLDPKLDLLPRLVAHMLWAASEHAVRAWQAAGRDYNLVVGAVHAVDEVVKIVNAMPAAKGVASGSG